METLKSNDNEDSTTPILRASHSLTEGFDDDIDATVIIPKRQKPWKHRHKPGNLHLFSDPLDGTSSDEQSFDEEDMFGSDSDAETVSLVAKMNKKKQPFDEQRVCIIDSVSLCHSCVDIM